MNIATIILATGENVSLDVWQGIYGLPRLGSKIGKYITLGEPYIPNGTTLAAPLIQIIDQVRLNGWPVCNFNSATRTQARQEELKANDDRAATTSPHVVAMAFDIDTTSYAESRKLAAELKKAAKMLGFKIRIGLNLYIDQKKTFVHVDVTPTYYAPGMPFHHKQHPPQWETEQIW
jgi:hypothetical protein